MKRMLSALLCLILLAGLLPALAEDVTEVMQVVKCKEYVSLRETPDTKAKRLVKVHLGELVYDCAPAANGFVKCSWEGKTGYILASYLKATAFTLNDGILPNQQVVKCDEYVSLREMPDSSSKRLKKVPLGEVVTGCISYMGNWVFCEYKGTRGYVLSKYLKKADYSAPKPTPKPTATPTPKTYPVLPYYMQVINCNSYITLRATPSTSGKALMQVPLGEVVEGCVQVSDDFVSCTYSGKNGYLLIKYLGAYQPPTNSTFDDLDKPGYDVFKTRGENVLEYTFNGYTVVVNRSVSQEKEEIMAVCYDPSAKAIWTVGDETNYRTELTLTDAFIAGSADKPLLVMFTVDKGFTAYEVGPWTDECWHNADSEKLSGNLATAVGRDGTTYAIGAFDYSMLAVTKEGETEFKTDHFNVNVYWPYKIELEQNVIYVYYDCQTPTAGMVYRDTYNYNGSYINTELVPRPAETPQVNGSDDAFE